MKSEALSSADVCSTAGVPPSGERPRVLAGGPCVPPNDDGLEALLRREAALPPGKLARRLREPNVADAEDLRQDVAVELLEEQAEGELEGPVHPASYWQRLRYRKLRLRRRRLREELRKPEVEAHLNVTAAAALSAEILDHRARVWAWLLDQVASSRRAVAEDNLFRGETLEAIALQRGQPIGTVRSQLVRAQADIQKAVARVPPEERAGLKRWLLLLAGLLSAVWLRVERWGRGQARPLLACAACVTFAVMLPGDAGRDETPALAIEEVEPPENHLNLTVVPYLPAWAEREHDGGTMTRARPARASDQPSLRSATGATERSASARNLLALALAAAKAGDLATARAARELYEATYGHDSYPGQHAAVAAETNVP